MTLAHKLLAEAQAAGITLFPREDERLGYKAPAGALDRTGLRQRLRRHKAEVLALLSVLRRDSTATTVSVVRPVVHFRLSSQAANTWSAAIGRPGESIESLIFDLRERWPGVVVRPRKPHMRTKAMVEANLDSP